MGNQLLIILLCFFSFLFATTGNTAGLVPGTVEYEASLLQDWAERSALPQTDMPQVQWYTVKTLKGWGPRPAIYPDIDQLIGTLPPGTDIAQWQRDRVVAIAKKYIDLPYRHHHIPAWSPATPDHSGKTGPGLDCSNFTSWVYNFGFGIQINSHIVKQAQQVPKRGEVLSPGRRLEADEPFLPGDLLFILKKDRSRVSHVVIFIDANHIIDSHKGKVAIRKFSGWYRTHLSHGIRIFE